MWPVRTHEKILRPKENPDPRLVKPYDYYINQKIDFEEYLKGIFEAGTEVFLNHG